MHFEKHAFMPVKGRLNATHKSCYVYTVYTLSNSNWWPKETKNTVYDFAWTFHEMHAIHYMIDTVAIELPSAIRYTSSSSFVIVFRLFTLLNFQKRTQLKPTWFWFVLELLETIAFDMKLQMYKHTYKHRAKESTICVFRSIFHYTGPIHDA